jgi:prophage regulatory protein
MAKSRKAPTLRLQTTMQSAAAGANLPSSRLDGYECRPAVAPLSPSSDTDGASIMTAHPQRQSDELWSISIVVAKTGLSRASIYRYIVSGLFPDRRSIGPGRVAWLASEVSTWIETRPRPTLP